MDRCALFVDAGYLLADGAMAVHGTRHREAVAWDYPGLLQLLSTLSRERTDLPLLRCYWYEATVEGRRTPEHDALADIPGLKLRLARIRPGRREGVDAQVHRDLMTLARNNAICDAVVVSGDEDLAQVVSDAQDLGIRVTVIHIAADGSWAVSRTLQQECDDLIEIGSGHLRPYVNLVTGNIATGGDTGSSGNGQQFAQPGSNGRSREGHAQSNGHNPPSGGSMPAAGSPAPSAHGSGSHGSSSYGSGSRGFNALESGSHGSSSASHGSSPASHGSSSASHGPSSGSPAPSGAPSGSHGSAPEPGTHGSGSLGSGSHGSGSLGSGSHGSGSLGSGSHGSGSLGSGSHGSGSLGSGSHGSGSLGSGSLGSGSHGSGSSGVSAHTPSDEGDVSAPGAQGPAAHGSGGPLDPGAPGSYGLSSRETGSHGSSSLGLSSQGPASHGVSSHGSGSHGSGSHGSGAHGSGSHGSGSHSSGGFHGTTGSHGSGSRGSGSPAPRPSQPALPAAYSGYGSEPQQPSHSTPQPPPQAPPSPPMAAPVPPQPSSAPGQYNMGTSGISSSGPPTYPGSQLGPYTGPQPAPVASHTSPGTTTLADAVKAAHKEGHDFGESVARDAPALWLEAVLARKPRMPSDLEARLLQGSSLPIDFLLHDEVRHALRRGFWDALERARR
ncbi:hypothetical protein GCM10022226_07710 [Sphaerisporangium flaviroseum]|uniref:NYN domain-containing protein n=1 Tax=Sphaerisporangium flaviroseum TaxID=509199 RepID=A0ABP7HCW1_9ACTN